MVKTNQDIPSAVRKVLLESLGHESIKDNDSIIRDLGADSIDYFDIIFRLEEKFKINIPISGVFPLQCKGFEDRKYFETLPATLNRDGIAEITAKYPHVNWKDFEKNPTLEEVERRENVQSLIRFIERLSPQPYVPNYQI